MGHLANRCRSWVPSPEFKRNKEKTEKRVVYYECSPVLWQMLGRVKLRCVGGGVVENIVFLTIDSDTVGCSFA